jgi:translocator protein
MVRLTANDIAEFGAAVLLCEFAGFIGSMYTTRSIPIWYVVLRKPLATPPSSVFSTVWIVLFALMGISLFLVWRKRTLKRPLKRESMTFSIQLILNILWSIVFFTFHSILGGLVVIAILWLAVFLTMTSFFGVSKTAAYLLVPYLLWITFALYLNAGIWALN